MRFNHMQTRYVSQIITMTVIIQVIVVPKPQNPDEVRICVDMRVNSWSTVRDMKALFDSVSVDRILSFVKEINLFSKI